MAHDEYSREPCPWRIVEDCGGAFSMGLIGGSLFQGIKGFRNAPSGINKRFVGGLTAIKTRSPMLAGSFAVWGLTFASFDCAFIHYRQKEDPWNSITSAAISGAVLSARNGPRVMIGHALFGAVLLGLMEAVGIFSTRVTAEFYKPQPLDFEQPPEGWRQ